MYKVISFLLILLIYSCSCGSGANGSKDVGIDTGILCGNGYYPSFDYQCKGNTGCREINSGLCTCRCVMCENERCVSMSCGDEKCRLDGGVDVDIGDLGIGGFEIYDFGIEDLGISDLKDAGEDIGGEEIKDVYVDDVSDVSDIRDISDIRDAGDVGVDDFEYVCKDPGDPVGVEFSGNLDAPIVKISDKVFLDAVISGDYIIWLSPDYSGLWGKEIYYLSLKDKKIRRVPNCDGYDAIWHIDVYGDRLVWNNFIDYKKPGNNQEVIFYFNITTKEIKIISPLDEVFHQTIYEDDVVYILWKDKKLLYYHNIKTGEERVIKDEPPYYLFDRQSVLWKRDIIEVSSSNIVKFNIDTKEASVIYESSYDMWPVIPVTKVPYIAIQFWLPEEKYGHISSDIGIFNYETNTLTMITDDENFQIVLDTDGKFVIFHENDDIKSTEMGRGYIYIYDVERKVKRKIPGTYGYSFPIQVNGRYILFTFDIASRVFPIYLADLEKLGVVKDGHVVPE